MTKKIDREATAAMQSITTYEHTPGPWRVDGSGAIAGIRPDDSGLPLAVTHPFLPVHYGDKRDRETMRANARLIASAPDLLAALEAIAALENPRSGDQGPIRRARHIAKCAIATT